MRDQQSVKSRRSYDAEFKQEVIRMLISGRSARETSEAFGIAEKRFAAAGSLSLEKDGYKKDKIE
jgi:transposase-like protein